MRLRSVILIYCFIALLHFSSEGQTCTTLGQNPGTAFPVCGTSTFSQSTVPICGSTDIPAPCTGASLFQDKNPFWYKFTCFSPGTLGFAITPNILQEDYDWQIFDITNHDPSEVYTNAALFVACNWSGEFGITGTLNGTQTGTSLSVCDGPGQPLLSKMPTLIQGHEYLMLVSHFSNTQSGYSLSFGGGTANITDPTDPHLKSAKAPCDGVKIYIKLNKHMKCSSLASNGSDFTITPAVANIKNATGIGCSNGFDLDSVILTLDAPLPPGTYTIGVKNGTDGNNLLDNCNRSIPSGETLDITIYPLIPTPMDSIAKPGCAPDEIDVYFTKKLMQCSSIAADGSDFIITGPTPVTVSGASGDCVDGLTHVVRIKLSQPIQTAGNYQVILKSGSDGNTILNECSMPTVAGATLGFTTVDTVSAAFSYTIRLGCVTDTIDYSHDGRNGVNSWQWLFDDQLTSFAKDTSITYTVFGIKKAALVVSNGTCKDTATVSNINLDNYIKADFENTENVCPGDPARFLDKSIGNISNWFWDFSNGNTSTDQNPAPQFYASSSRSHDETVTLTITNSIGCSSTAVKSIHVVNNCYIAVPKAFSPNRDGLNDYLYPTNAYKARNLKFRVYNRNGQLIFETGDWTNKWDGTFKGMPQDPGTYVWTLTYTHIDTGVTYNLKGSSVLIR